MRPVLIVEDEAIMRESLRDWLNDIGYQVETVEDGPQALNAMEQVEFGVVVLDLRLPGKDGLQVWKEAKARSPHLKGIIITAYPSIETAVQAMKLGAVDYLVKPFPPDALEKLVRETLGPVQLEIKPKAGMAEIAEAPAITEVKEELAELGIEVIGREIPARVVVRPRECVWMQLGVVSYRLCTHDYDCLTCEFDQSVQERIAAGEAEIEEALRKQLEIPGSRRLCRYAMKGEVSYRTCSRLFQCIRCEFAQRMEDALEQKLSAREEAIRKKGQSWWWSYWGEWPEGEKTEARLS